MLVVLESSSSTIHDCDFKKKISKNFKKNEGELFFQGSVIVIRILELRKRKKKKNCTDRESNPGLPRGRREFYH